MSYNEDIRKIGILQLPWDKLSGCNILVVGSTGLIGSTLVNVLLSREKCDYHVYACGRNEERAKKLFAPYWNQEGFHFIKHDMAYPLNTDISYHFIIHCASGAAPEEFVQHPVEVMKANFIGVSNLIDYGIKHSLHRFLYVSSGEVYGEGDGRLFDEDYSGYVNTMCSRSCYPSSKRAAETLCVSYAEEYGVDVTVARPCHIYGPSFTELDNRVYAQFIRNVLNNEDIVMKSTGEQFRSWCYVLDCVSALLHILLKGKSGEAYNIADENSNISIRQLAEMIAGIAEKKVVIDQPSEIEVRSYNKVQKSVFSTQKIRNLGWRCEGGMDVKMKDTIEMAEKLNLS